MRGGRGEHRSARCRRQSRVPALSAVSLGLLHRIAPLRIAWRDAQLCALRKRIVPDITHVHWADSRALAAGSPGSAPGAYVLGLGYQLLFQARGPAALLWMIRAPSLPRPYLRGFAAAHRAVPNSCGAARALDAVHLGIDSSRSAPEPHLAAVHAGASNWPYRRKRRSCSAWA